MSNFQTIFVAVFLAFFVFAVLIFSGLLKIGESSSNASKPKGKIVVWGTFHNPDLYRVFEDATQANKELNVSYVRKIEVNYQQTLIEAFAKGTGPDLFIIPSDMIVKNDSFIYKIPFTSYPEKTFRDSFIDGADVFLAPDGVVGFPIVVDPIVLYYNRDLFSNEGIPTPPVYWDELLALSSSLTKKKDDGTILQSMIALGRYDNITNSKEILSTLLIQNNNPIIKRLPPAGYIAVLNDNSSQVPVSSAERILKFFIEFSNPSHPVYSWNQSLPKSIDMFTSGRMAMYLGRASELFKIQSVNPNLSFDVTDILQTRDAKNKRTYGKIYAIAVNKKSTNLSTAFSVAGILSAGDNAKKFAISVSLPPASRALLADKPTDPYLFTFFKSAIVSRAWLDPDANASNGIFAELIQNILSNKLSISEAVNKAQNQMSLLISRK